MLRRFRSLCLALAAAVSVAAAEAPEPQPRILAPEAPPAAELPPSTPPPPAPAAPDPAAPQAFFDELFRAAVQEHGIPGLAAVFVQDGKVVYAGAYGWADVERRIPVDAATTVFPLGSITKLFTSLAVLKLVEEQRLDLDADVQRYIAPLQIDQRFPQPVTLRHILTHTDGFDVRWLFGGAAADPAQLQDLRALLSPLPPRIEPPGELYLYSDVGISLAAYAVEQVSGRPFGQYMEAEILGPLGMTRSTFHPWRTESGRMQRATGYEDTYDGSGTNRPLPVAYPRAMAAAGLHAPVTDLVPFLLAHLAPPTDGTAGPISPDLRRWLASRQFSHHDGIPGTCFGFYEYQRNGERGLLHGGLMLGFTSVVFLLPEHQTGLAVVANKFGLVSFLEEQLLQRYLDRYHPAAGPTPPPATPAANEPRRQRPDRYDGRYRGDQYSRRSADKLALASGWGSEIVVRSEPDGRLHFEPGGWWRPVGPDLFQNEATGERVAFRGEARGRAWRIVGSAQFMSYHRLGWFDRLSVQAGLAGGFVATVLSAAGAGGALGWHRSRRAGRAPPAVRVVRWLSGLTALLVVAALAGLYLTMRDIDFATAFLGDLPILRVTVQLPVWFTLTGAAVLVLTLTTSATAWPSRVERRAHLVLGLAVTAFLPVLAYWNLLAVPVSI